MATQQNWTKTGEEFIGKPVDPAEWPGLILARDMVVKAIENLKWEEVPNTGLEMDIGSAMAIEAAIRDYKIPRVSHVATSNDLAPWGFYGIRGHYTNGVAEIYIMDMGSQLATVRSDFTPNEGDQK
jgi:hypothetical protein